MANIALITNNILSDSGTALTSVVTGSGTTNYLSKFTGSTALGNSLVYDDGTFVGIGTTTPTYKLDVNGTTRVSSTTAASSLVFTSTTSSIATASVKVDTIGGFFRAYGSAFSVASLASKVSFGPDGADGIVVFSNPTQASGSTGSISLRGGGYDTAAEMLFIDQNGSRFTNGYVLIGTSTNAGYKLDVNGTGRFQNTLYVATTGTNASPVSALRITSSDNGNGARIEFNDNNVGIMRSSDQLQFREYTGGFNFIRTSNSNTLFGISQTSTNVYYGTLTTSGSITAATALARGVYFNNTLVAAANNDVLVGLDINPTFTNGAFTGVSNFAARINGILAGVTQYWSTGTSATSHYLQITSASGSSANVNLRNQGGSSGTAAYHLFNGSARFEANAGTGQVNIGANDGTWFTNLISEGVSVLRIFTSSRNVAIQNGGTFTDAGYRLDVNGTARVQYGTVERGVIFTHSNGTYAEIVLGNGSAAGVGVVEIHRNGTSAISLRSNAVLFNTSRLVTPSTFFVTGPYGGSNIGTSVRLASNTVDQGVYTATSGTQSTVVIGNSGNEIWQPSSGTATYNLFSVLPSINTSGTYAGIVRGFYYSPTLTSITGVTHRAIETVTGNVIFGSTSGNVGIGTTSPAAKLDVVGDTKITGSASAGNYSLSVYNSSNTLSFYVRGFGDALLAGTLFLGTQNGPNFISNGTLGITSSQGAGNQFVRFTHNNGNNAFRILTNSVIELNPVAGNVLIGTTTDAGFKLDVNGTARVQGVITGSVSSGSLTLGAAASNSQAITITGYFTGNGAISIANSNPRSFNTNLGGQGYGYSTSYNSVAQNQTTTNIYFSATGNINLTDGAIDLNGFNFNPTIISETGATIKAFSSGLNAASNRWNLYINGTAKNYLAGNLLIGSTTDSGEKLQVNGSGNFNLGNSGYIKLQSGSGQRHGFVQSAFSNFLFSNNIYYDGSNWRYDQNGYGAQIQTETLSVGVIAFNTFASGTAGNIATIIESMRIVNNGNILMGDPNDYGFKLQVNGTSIFSDTIIQDYGNNSNASRGITSYIAQSNLTNDYVNGYYSGETISGELASTVSAGQVVAMKANSLQWELADASTAASIGKNMLGIACYGGNSTDVITILLNGFFASNTYYGNSGNYGVPMYLNASTNGSLTDVAPSTTGNIVRIVGHIDNYSNSNGCAVVRFNPDNFWLVI